MELLPVHAYLDDDPLLEKRTAQLLGVQLKLIAEPWDVGPGGYQVGNFAVIWTEWNGKYRDATRAFWKGDRG